MRRNIRDDRQGLDIAYKIGTIYLFAIKTCILTKFLTVSLNIISSIIVM